MPHDRPIQFSLQSLLLAVVVVWSSLATFGIRGIVVAGGILLIVGYIRSAESMWRAAVIAGLVLLGGFTCLCLGVSLRSGGGGENLYRNRCMSYLKFLGLALRTYHEANGCFPPTYLADADGKPMHSWRVLILPYIEEQALYNSYNFNEPWDGPNNRKLASKRPWMFACPSVDRTGSPAVTNYVAVVGPRTMWPKDKAVSIDDIPDGTANTLMLVEMADSDINWMEPRDLSFEEAMRGVNPESGGGISSRHSYRKGYFYHDTPCANVVLADGTVVPLPQGVSSETLKALLTIDDGEPIAAGFGVPARLDWAKCLSPVALLISVILLLARPRRKDPEQPDSPVGT